VLLFEERRAVTLTKLSRRPTLDLMSVVNGTGLRVKSNAR
jgi:hypothetical protein